MLADNENVPERKESTKEILSPKAITTMTKGHFKMRTVISGKPKLTLHPTWRPN